MNTLNFQTLEIIVESESCCLRDDGFVPDIREHEDEVNREHLDPMEYFIHNSLKGDYITDKDKGLCIILPFESKKKAVIFYNKHSCHRTNIFRRGHEETHALHEFGFVKILHERLEERGLRINLKKYSDLGKCSQHEKELVANIGGIYSMDISGVNILHLKEDNFPPDILFAMKLYKDAIRERDFLRSYDVSINKCP